MCGRGAGERILIEADAFTPGAAESPFATNLLQQMRDMGLDVELIAPIHGQVVPLGDLERLVQELATETGGLSPPVSTNYESRARRRQQVKRCSRSPDIARFTANRRLFPRSRTDQRGGAVIFPSGTGYVPALEGRLEPVLDTHDRMYIYADNVAVNGGLQQPVAFTPGEEPHLEDAEAHEVLVSIAAIVGRAALVQYRRTWRSALPVSPRVSWAARSSPPAGRWRSHGRIGQ